MSPQDSGLHTTRTLTRMSAPPPRVHTARARLPARRRPATSFDPARCASPRVSPLPILLSSVPGRLGGPSRGSVLATAPGPHQSQESQSAGLGPALTLGGGSCLVNPDRGAAYQVRGAPPQPPHHTPGRCGYGGVVWGRSPPGSHATWGPGWGGVGCGEGDCSPRARVLGCPEGRGRA